MFVFRQQNLPYRRQTVTAGLQAPTIQRSCRQRREWGLKHYPADRQRLCVSPRRELLLRLHTERHIPEKANDQMNLAIREKEFLEFIEPIFVPDTVINFLRMKEQHGCLFVLTLGPYSTDASPKANYENRTVQESGHSVF